MSGWDHRPPTELQMGNGTLLATFTFDGEVEQLYAPSIDALQSRLGAFRTSAVLPAGGGEGNGPPELIRINSENFHIRLKLLEGSQVLQAEYQHRHRPLRLMRQLGIHPKEPILLDQWRVLEEKCGLLHESIPWMGGSTSAHCSLYHPSFNGLVHHRGRRWLGIMVRGESQWVRVGHLSEQDRYRLWSGEQVSPPIGSHELGNYPSGPVRSGWDQVVQGCATWGAIATGPSQGPNHVPNAEGQQMEFAIICAESEVHLGKLLGSLEHVPSHRYFNMVNGMVARRHAPAAGILNRIHNSRVRALCERSIDVLHSLQDARTGALMAAAEVDPHSRLSGGYGYSWPRDGAYLASALGAFGFHDRVEHYLKFLTDTQDVSGAWWQRYLATGHAGPSWGRIQIDEPASVIGAACQHFARTRDLLWLERFWPTLEKGLSFLKSFHSPEHPMGLPSHDLWEERMGIHAYSLAAVASAFLGGAYLARELSDRKAQRDYHDWSRRILAIIHEKFLTPEGQIRRSFVVNTWDYTRGGGNWDELTDVSLLGLISPFGMLKARDPIARKILEQIRGKLWCRNTGGLFRYEYDTYRGGNPWILTTLWLGIIELQLGNMHEAKECFNWTISKATPLGMLAEQVHRDSGNPFWVIPLGWSHAMFLLFVREVLDRGKETEIWDIL